MKYVSIAALLIVLVMSGCRRSQNDITTFILVRHAEKGDDGTQDPDLADAGRTRAEMLAAMFKDTPIAAIYSRPINGQPKPHLLLLRLSAWKSRNLMHLNPMSLKASSTSIAVESCL